MWVELSLEVVKMARSHILKTKLQPPRPRSSTLPRPGITASLEQLADYPLVLVQAGPGYGKSTLLVDFCRYSDFDCLWYRLQEDDNEPGQFVRHLEYLFGEKIAWKEEKGEEPGEKLELLVNDLFDSLNSHTLLILDNFQEISEDSGVQEIVARLVEISPHRLHLVLISRVVPNLSRLVSWRAKGEVLEIRREALALSPEETREFFLHQYDFTLEEKELKTLWEYTRGWIMAMEIFGPMLKQGLGVEKIVSDPEANLPQLWAFLNKELFLAQEEELQEFLLKTSILKVQEEAASNFISGREDSRHLLEQFVNQGLMTREVEGRRFAYHPLWQQFLQEKLRENNPEWSDLHRQMARFFQDRGSLETAIYHLLEAGDQTGAAQLIAQNIQFLEEKLPQQELKAWIAKISDGVFDAFPRLLLYRGDLARYSSDYGNALKYYQRAREIFQKRGDQEGLLWAYQKLAMVYLDTVEPSRAEDFLRRGLALQEEVERSGETHLLELLAENRANRGDARGARRLLQASQKLGEEAASPQLELHLESRLLLRTGRLQAARQMLEKVVEEGTAGPERFPKTHRESPMVLSLLYVFEGRFREAITWARKGLELARKLDSPFTEAVGYMRLGHADQLKKPGGIEEAVANYEKALKLMDRVGVQRGRVEGLWGLTTAFGQLGRIQEAQRYGEECINIALQAGDEWMANLGRLSLGLSFVQGGKRAEGRKLLATALENFGSLNDYFGRAQACFWLALAEYEEGLDGWQERFLEGLRVAREENYGFLLNSPTFLGIRDTRRLVPLLIGVKEKLDSEMQEWSQEQSGIKRWDYHPGFTLKIRALGPMKVWRGIEEITDGHWKREKAKELFQLFIAFRNELLPRERIFELLWPHQDLETAGRDFKVALNALNSVLEPDRRARITPYFIKRSGQAYGLDPEASWEVDADEFEKKIKEGLKTNDPELLAEAINLYQGDFLSFSLYFDWIRESREKLRRFFFQGCERLARHYLASGFPERALEISERMLARDRCWEVAYQLAMEAYLQMGDRYLAQRMYLDCVRVLQEELAVEPLPATRNYIEKVFTAEELARMEKELAREGGLNQDGKD